MNRIEVDPKLFITCRLCLDEMGQYQIVPKVQEQIMYCFDIRVESFDGLPQLICKKCEGILSQYAGIKQIFQEKQSSLKTKLKNKETIIENIQQQQDIVSSTQQVESDNSNLIIATKTNFAYKSTSERRSSCVTGKLCTANDDKTIKKNVIKKPKSPWKADYLRYFVCSFCSKQLKDKRSILKHTQQCHLIRKYSDVLRSCAVRMNKIESTPNLTASKENVVWSKDRIINCKNANYYILYTKSIDKCSQSESSDEDFRICKVRGKRPRLLSKSSNETLVIDQSHISKDSITSDYEEDNDNKINNKEYTANNDDVELVQIDDSDSASTTSTLKTSLVKTETNQDKQKPHMGNDKTLQNIITMCLNKYLTRFDTESGNPKCGSSKILERKILNIGQQVIHNKGFKATGLLRYMEKKELDVKWIQKPQSSVYIKIYKEFKSDNHYSFWKSFKDVHNSFIPVDSVGIFEDTMQEGNSTKSNKVHLTQPCLNNKKESNLPEVQVHNSISQEFQNSNLQILYFDNNDNLSNRTTSKNPEMINGGYERKVENSILYLRTNPEPDKNTMLTKLLNANPVANPKQLPKKASHELFSLLTSSSGPTYAEPSSSNVSVPVCDTNVDRGSEEQMPIITSTISLANVSMNSAKTDKSGEKTGTNCSPVVNKPHKSLPRIKVKPVSELMPMNSSSQQESVTLQPNVSSNNNESQTIMTTLQNPGHNYVITTNLSPISNVNVFPQQNNVISFPQLDNNQQTNIMIVPSSNVEIINNPSVSYPSLATTYTTVVKPIYQQYVVMHTVELPNMSTDSPFKYFQDLLQIHKLVLLNGIDTLTDTMSCLIKFKLVFQQGSADPVTLRLSLYYNNNTFCIGVTDSQSKNIDISKLSAYWQWEILKEFKGHVMNKLFQNALKLSSEVFSKTEYFVNLLNSIVFSKKM